MAKNPEYVHNNINSMLLKYLELEADSMEELEDQIAVAKAFGYLIKGSKKKTTNKIKVRMGLEYSTTLDKALDELLRGIKTNHFQKRIKVELGID